MNRHGRLGRIVGLVILVGAAYAYTWYWLYVRWTAPDSLFSHGFLIPFVSLWLVARRKERLARIEPEPATSGLFLIVPALVFHLLALYAEVYSPSAFTLPLLLGGFIVYFRGWPSMRVLFFPVFFLYFAVPAPMNWVFDLSFRLKILAVHGSTVFARFLGADLEESGSSILFGNGGSLPVENPCSGLRSLLALVALGMLYAVEFASLNLKGRTVFVLLTVPIAIASNILRITFLCLVVDRFGVGAAAGAVHDVSGYAVYLVALLFMMASGRFLSSISLFQRRAPCEENA